MKTWFFCAGLIWPSLVWAATTEIRFVDDCTGEPVTLGSPNGIRLEVEIQGLEKQGMEPVLLDLTLGPVGSMTGAPKPISLLKKKKVWPKEGRVFFQTKVDPKKVQVLQAQVLWTQNENLGGSVGTLLMPRSSREPFYKRLSEPICYWETPAEIESGHYSNSSTGTLALKKSFDWNLMRGGLQGVTEGPPPIPGHGGLRFATGLMSPNPLTGTPLMGLSLWLFRGREMIHSQGMSVTVDRKWTLEPGQGGFFGSRWWFTRFRSEEFVLRRGLPMPPFQVQTQAQTHNGTDSCWRWTPVRRGYLDVGIPRVDFYVVPESESSNSKRAAEYIENIEPALNTCKTLSGKNGVVQLNSTNSLATTAQELLVFNPEEE